MKLLFSWLKDFVPLDLTAEQTGAVLAGLGFEIVAVRPVGPSPEGVVTALIETCEKHPQADRLSLCRVSDGTSTYQIVCGAPNAASGHKVALARIGAKLSKGIEIKAAKIRGVDSEGMLCSTVELGLPEKSEGIMILDPSTPLGTDIRTALGWDDYTIEFEITPNRRDVLSVLGVARELAAALNLSLKQPEPRPRELDPSTHVSVSNEAPELCFHYIARAIRGVKVAPSPAWMVRRLALSEIRSINNIVDITNYVMLELGQPLHAFDLNKLKGKKLRVRKAHDAEPIALLDGKTIALKPSMLVIADEEKPVALAGIMGGSDSAISNDTNDIVLESASFLPSNIRQTSRTLTISTDSSYRFERGTDLDMVGIASARAAQLIQELAGGMGFKPMESSSPRPQRPAIRLRVERVRQLLGIDLKESVIIDMLRRLGCIISRGSESHMVNAPSWRADLELEADLIEEVARLYGYNNIPTKTPSVRVTTVPDNHLWTFERMAARTLAGMGLTECCNSSFSSQGALQAFIPGFGQPADSRPLRVQQPLSVDLNTLRTSLLPGLLASVAMNFRHRQAGISFFEIGRTFAETASGINESRRLGIVLGGIHQPAHWREKTRPVDFYDLLGLLEAFFSYLKLPAWEFAPFTAPSLHPKRSQTISVSGTPVAWIGEIHPRLASSLDCQVPLVAAELDIEALYSRIPSKRAVVSPSPYPAVSRDLSVVTSEGVLHESIVGTIKTIGGASLESCNLIDLYRGSTIGTGKKSLTFSLVFRNPSRTLTDAEVELTMKTILSELKTRCDAELRQ